MAHWLIRHPNPLILIDWSDLHEDCRWQLLRASIPMSGRAVTVLEMIFPESMKGSPRAEKTFLQRLRAVLPVGIKPIVVTDAGFRAPWLRTVAQFNWYYVGRLRGHTRIQIADGVWFDNRELHERIRFKAHRLQDVRNGQKQSLAYGSGAVSKASPRPRAALSAQTYTQPCVCQPQSATT